MSKIILVGFITILVSLSYFGITDGSAMGQSLGKKLVNISTRDSLTGGPVGIPRAAARILIMDLLGLPFLFFIPWLLDVLWPLWD